jgi:adenine-specific DNA-methyltransferase
MDEVDSTIGHYASYLSDWSPRSYREMKLRVPRSFRKRASTRFIKATFSISSRSIDAISLLRSAVRLEQRQDAAFARALRAYYHLWTSICLFDNPPLSAKQTGARHERRVSASVFEEFRKNERAVIVVEAIERLLRERSATHHPVLQLGRPRDG